MLPRTGARLGDCQSAGFTREPQGFIDERLRDTVAIGLYLFQCGRNAFELADPSGLQQYTQHAKQRHTQADCSLPTTALVHQYSTAQCVRQTQSLRFAFVEMADGSCIDGIIAAGMNLCSSLHEGSDLDRAGTRAIFRGFVQHCLRHMEDVENSDEQFESTAPGQRNQWP